MGLLIFIGYYFILTTAFTLTKDAALPPWLTFWTPHLLLGALGIFFLYQSSLEKPNFLVSRLDQAMLILQKRARKNVDS